MNAFRKYGVGAAFVAGLLASTSAWAVVVNVDLESNGEPVTGVTISFETAAGEPITFADLADLPGEAPPLVADLEPADEPSAAETQPATAVVTVPKKPAVRTVKSNSRGKANVDIPGEFEGKKVVIVVTQDDGRETRREVALTGGIVNVAIDLPAAAPPNRTGPRPRLPQPVVAEPSPIKPAVATAPETGCGLDPAPGCIEFSAGPVVSIIEKPAILGSGTVVNAPFGIGAEYFGARLDTSIPRYGVDADVKIGLGPGLGLPGGGNSFLEGKLIHASGDQSAAGTAAIGVNGVGGVGYTFIVPGGAGTGIIGTASGFGINSNVVLRNDWTVGTLSYGQVFDLPGSGGDFTDAEADGAKTKLQYTIGLQFEQIRVRSSGRTDLTFGGMPFGGFSQTYDYSSKDRYFGVKLGAAVYHQPNPNWRFHVGASIVPGIHSGRSAFTLASGVGGTATYTEAFADRRSNFTLGGGVEAGLSYLCDNGWGIDLVGYGDILPSVTSFTMPSSPGQQSGAGYGSSSLLRGGFTLRARIAF